MRYGIFFLLMVALPAFSEAPFRFQHRKGEMLRFLGIVNQRVWGMASLDPRVSLLEAALDPRYPWVLVQTVQMLNRIQQETLDVDAQGRGLLRGTFQVTQQKVTDGGTGQGVFMLEEEYESKFWRDPQGRFEIASHFYMPVVRNIPTFPDSFQQEWTAPAEEVHDMLREFSITTPLRVPVKVTYRRGGRRVFEGKEYETFLTEYSFEQPTGFPLSLARVQAIPLVFAGKIVQTIFWDSTLGRKVFYEGDYVLALRLSNGNVFRFEGDAQARMIEAPPMDRELEAARLRETLREADPGITVRPTERGVTIELPESFISFPPDSAELLPTERSRLQRIAQILRNYPTRDLQIDGHTAMAGTEEGRLRLSQQRAEAVGNFLLQSGVRTREQMIFRGWGAARPIAPNDNEANRARNRRVEITILEN